MTLVVLGLAASLTAQDTGCQCQTTTTTTAPCNCPCNTTPENTTPVPTYQNGLVNLWEFNGDLNDWIGHDNIQQCMGGISWDSDRLGNADSALTLIHAYCTLPGGIYVSGPFSIAIWAKLPTVNQAFVPLLFLSNNIYQDAVELAVSWDSGSPTPSFMIQSGMPIVSEVISSNAWTLGQWYHVVAVYDGTTASLYVNGELDCSSPVSQPILGVFRMANAFGINEQGATSISVTLDDGRIYSRALSADEISALYQSNNAAPAAAVDSGNVTTCSTSPAGVCQINCDGDFDYYYHESEIPCPYGQRCCIASPAQPDNGCTQAQGYCVQRDACTIDNLMYVSGCDSGSVIPICCKVPNYYNVPNNPFGNGTDQQCNGFGFGCTQGGDCCSDDCSGTLCD